MLLILTNYWARYITLLQLLSCKFYKDIRYKDENINIMK